MKEASIKELLYQAIGNIEDENLLLAVYTILSSDNRITVIRLK